MEQGINFETRIWAMARVALVVNEAEVLAEAALAWIDEWLEALL